MLKPLLLALALLGAPLAQADEVACAGQDLIATMPAKARHDLDQAVAAVPYPAGNHWRATKGDSIIDVIGTFHIFDPHMPAHLQTLTPVLQAADTIYLEATQTEIDALQKAIATKPDLLFRTGATLPERLSKTEWQQVTQELSARGIPGIFAAKFQPWYVSMLLSLPACAMKSMGAGPTGMDHLILQTAADLHIPTLALEPYDTVFKLLGALSPADQLDMIRQTLPQSAGAEDMLATMSASYERQDHRQIWEYSRLKGIALAPDAAKAAQDFSTMEQALVITRNQAWMQVILPAAPGKKLVIAVGAGHLAGQQGLLNLLAMAGYDLQKADF